MDTAATKDYVEFVISLKLQEMKRGLNETAKDLADFQRRADGEFNKVKKSVADLEKKGTELKTGWAASIGAMKSELQGLTVASAAAFAGIAASAGVAVATFADFQQQMNTLRAVSGASNDEMMALKATAQELGATTKYSASQMAATQVEMAKLGFTSGEIVASMRGIVSAAAAAGVSLEEAGELVAGTVRGFGMSASEAEEVADVLAKAANASALSMSDLSLSMKYVAPVASAANQSLTDMVGIMGVLSNNMIKGETAGTAMRAMMVRLQAPAGEAQKIFDKLSFSAADAEGKIRPMPALILELQQKLSRFNQASQNKILAEIFGTEALSAASALMKTSESDLKAMITQMENAGGASKEMGEVMQQGVNHQLDMLKSASEGVANSLGEQLAPAAEKVLKALTSFLGLVNDLPDPVKKTAAEITILAGSVTALGLALGTAGLGVTRLIGKLKTLAAISPAISGLLKTLGVVGIGVAGATLASNIQGAANDLNDQAAEIDIESTSGAANRSVIEANKAMRKAYEQEMLQIAAAEKEFREKLTGAELDKALENLAKRKQDAASKIGDLSVLTSKELEDLSRNLIEAKTQYQREISDLKKIPRQLADLRDQLEKEMSKGGRSKRALQLQNQIQDMEKELSGVNRGIRGAEGQIQRLTELQQRMDAARKKRKQEEEKPEAGTETFDMGDGKDKEAQKQLEAARKHFKEMSLARADYARELQKNALDHTKLNDSAQNASSEFADKLVQSGEKAVTTMRSLYKETGRCLRGINEAFIQATGKPLHLANSAYEAAATLEKDARFQETQWDRKSTLPAGAIVVWGKGKSTHGHISMADGQGNELSDHKARQMTQHYGGAAPRVFIPKGSDAGGMTKAQREEAANQMVLNQMLARYNEDLAKAIAYRDQLPQQSKAWEEADSEVSKLQQEAGDLGLDLTKSRMKLEEEAREQARRWAAEALDLEAQTAQARAALTADTQDDIYANHLATLNRIEVAEQAMLAREELNNEQRKEHQKNFAAQRELAEKQLTDALYQDRVSKERAVEDLLIEGERRDIERMEDSLQKRLAMQQHEEDNRRTMLKRKLADLAQTGKAETGEYALLEQELSGLKERGEQDRLKITQDYAGQRRRAEIDAEEKVFNDRKRSGELSGNLVSLEDEKQARQRIHEQRMAQIKQELAEALAAEIQRAEAAQETTQENERILSLRRELNDEQVRGQLEVLELVRRESDIRRDMINQVATGLASIAEAAGLDEALGGAVSKIAGMMPMLQTAGGAFSKLMAPPGKEGKTIGLENLDMNEITSMVGVAVEAGKLFWGVMRQAEEANRLALPRLQEQAETFKLELQALDNQILRHRIERRRQAGAELAELYEDERKLAQQEAQHAIRELEQQYREFARSKQGVLGIMGPKEQWELVQAWDQLGAKRTQIEADLQNRLLNLEQQRLERERQSHMNHYRELSNMRLQLAENNAQLSGDPVEQARVQRQRDEDAAMRAWNEAGSRLDQHAYTTGEWDWEAYRMNEQLYNSAMARAEQDFNERLQQIAKEDISRQARVDALTRDRGTIAASMTEDPFDDILAAHEKAMAELEQARNEALEDERLTEAQRAAISAYYNDKILQARFNLNKQLSDTRKSELKRLESEYKEELGLQRQLIEDQLADDRKGWDAKIQNAERALRVIRDAIAAHERELEASRKAREAALKPFAAGDAVQSEQWKADMAAFNANPDAWQGVDALSNVNQRGGLQNVSPETRAKGLREQAELEEFRAQNAFKREDITLQQFAERMQKAQLMRARAAEWELETEGLTVRQRIELEGEWADAYERYQDYARQAINARYDVEEARIQGMINAKQEEARAQEEQVRSAQDAIEALTDAAAAKTRLIDEEVQRVERSTRSVGDAWADVTAGIARAREEMELARQAAENMVSGSSYGPGSGGSGGWVPTPGFITPDTSSSPAPAHTGGYSPAPAPASSSYSPYTSSPIRANKGGFAPFNERYRGDKYPAVVQPGEAMIPFERWPEILLPIVHQVSKEGARPIVYNPQINISGNQIVGEFDMHRVASDAAREVWNEFRGDINQNVGRWA